MLRHATTNLPRRRAPAHRPFWHAVFVFQQYIRRLDAESNMTTNAEQSELSPQGSMSPRVEENDTEMPGKDTEKSKEEHEQQLRSDVVFVETKEDLGDLMVEYSEHGGSPLPLYCSPPAAGGCAASPPTNNVAVPASPSAPAVGFPPCPLPSLQEVFKEVFQDFTESPDFEVDLRPDDFYEGCVEKDYDERDAAQRYLSRLGYGPMGGAAGGAAGGIAGGIAGDAEDVAFAVCVSTLGEMKRDNDAVGPARKLKGAEFPAEEGNGAEGPANEGGGAPKRARREFKVSRNVTREDVDPQDMSKINDYMKLIKESPGQFEVETNAKNGKPGNKYVVDEKKTIMLLMASALDGTLDRDIQYRRVVLYSAASKHTHIYCSCPLDDAPTMQGRRLDTKRHRAGVGFCPK